MKFYNESDEPFTNNLILLQKSQLLANDEKIEFEFDWKMLTQDILETAKISQLSWGTFEKEKKEGFSGDISTFVGVQSLENSAFRYSSCCSP